MKFKAVDLSRITPLDLRFNPQPPSKWPTVEIDVHEKWEDTCIASWKWDIATDNEISDKLSECVWDSLHLGFSYLLCDVVSLPQNDPDLSEKLIEFSQLYRSLHAVIAYTVDDEMKRPWLRNEAYKILESPTNLVYVYHKWKLRMPLLFSLVINQICIRRIGISEITTQNLP